MTAMTGKLAAHFEDRKQAAGLKPWPHYGVDHKTWIAIGRTLGAGGGDLLSLWSDGSKVYMAVRGEGLTQPHVVSAEAVYSAFPSIGQFHPPALRFERAIRDLYGLAPTGNPDQRPWLDHGAWGVRTPLGIRNKIERRDPADYDFLPVKGEGLHQIPVGPVHAGIIEPGHFRFTANGETVVRLEERLGYVHKGIDGLLTNADIDRAARIAARVSGDSTVATSFAFARAVEAALDVSVPPRAQVLRGVMAELERIANHLGDIGAICNDAAFALIHAYCGILRERVLAAADSAFGHRLMMDRIVPGGLAEEIVPGSPRRIVATLEEIVPRLADVVRVYDETPSLQDRTCGTGIVGRELVDQWAAGGHVGRASGRDFDSRRDLAYPPYDTATFEVPVREQGDVDARVWIRVREIEASIGLVKTWLADLPRGPLRVDLPEVVGRHEGIAMVEAFRGDLLVWVRVDGLGRVARCHIRDASWLQWPLLEVAIENNIVADFPLCNKSFNCSYSGHDL